MYVALVRTYNHIIGMVCMLKLIMKRLKIELYMYLELHVTIFVYLWHLFTWIIHSSQGTNHLNSNQKVYRWGEIETKWNKYIERKNKKGVKVGAAEKNNNLLTAISKQLFEVVFFQLFVGKNLFLIAQKIFLRPYWKSYIIQN